MEISTFTPYIETYKFPAIFIGSFFFGEAAILSAVFLAREHHWSLPFVFLLALGGTLSADIAWFFLGKRALQKLHFWHRFKEKYATLIQKLRSQNPARQAYFLLIFKFLYGTRIVTILYVSLHKMPFYRFLAFDMLGTILWLSVLVLLGSALFSGVSSILQNFHLSQYILAFLLVLILILKGIHLWFEKRNQ